jgi:hypothetical protein
VGHEATAAVATGANLPAIKFGTAKALAPQITAGQTTAASKQNRRYRGSFICFPRQILR